VARMYQRNELFDPLSARDNVALAIAARAGPYRPFASPPATERVASDELLERVGLGERGDTPAKALSHGERRQLELALALALRPRVLLLDEPTVGVDPQSRERIYGMIGELKSRGVGLLYTTHYMEEAERLCDRIAIIDHGKIIAEGTKDELVRRTLGAGQALVIDAAAPIPPALKAELETRKARVEGERVLLTVTQPAEEIRRILESFHAHRVAVRDLTLKSPTLEQVFLQLTGRELRE